MYPPIQLFHYSICQTQTSFYRRCVNHSLNFRMLQILVLSWKNPCGRSPTYQIVQILNRFLRLLLNLFPLLFYILYIIFLKAQNHILRIKQCSSIPAFILKPWLKTLSFEAEISACPKLLAVPFQDTTISFISSRWHIILINKFFNKKLKLSWIWGKVQSQKLI